MLSPSVSNLAYFSISPEPIPCLTLQS